MASLLGMATTPPVEPDPSIVTPGLLGLVLVLALGLVVVFLYKSMNSQLRRVDFPEPTEGADEHESEPTA